MKMLAIVVSAAICLSASAAFAGGPKSFQSMPDGATDDGRKYQHKVVSCHGNSEGEDIFYFEDKKKWCVADESYCNRDMMRVAKKACKLG